MRTDHLSGGRQQVGPCPIGNQRMESLPAGRKS
jgi:hypothetical protein